MISIIIVSYNACELLKKCIDSIIDNVSYEYELIIVDNASDDETVNYLKNISEKCKVIFNERNLGFSKANNIGVNNSTGDLIHFLNPDTVVDKSINDVYKKVVQKNDVIYSTSLKENDNRIQGGHVMPIFSNLTRWLRKKRIIRWYIGASIIMSRENYDILGGWSEDYFMYSEDLDLCYKAYQNNIEIYEIHSNIQHCGGGSSKTVWDAEITDIKKEISYLKFIDKYNLYINYWAFFFASIVYNAVKYGEFKLCYRVKIVMKALYEKKYNQ